MAWSFGDSFDLYAAVADAFSGYWDSGAVGATILVAGRFSGSQALQQAGVGLTTLVKSSATNDAVHHLVCAFRQTAVLSGATLGTFFELFDGTTAQCSIGFRSDGAILLTSGGPTGTVLATYTGAVAAQNTWYGFEFEVSINNATGVFNVRKNGNTSNDFSASSLNTRGGTANNYANKLTIGMQATVSAQQIDDLFWQSGAATGAWLGDIRCYARMPASDQSVQYSKSGAQVFAQCTNATSQSILSGAGFVRTAPVIAPVTGVLASLTFNLQSAVTGHVKMALYSDSGGPNALLASSVELTNPGAGVTVFSVSGGPTVTNGTTYWVAIWNDANITGLGGAGSQMDYLAVPYGPTFPSTLAGFSSGSVAGWGSNGMNVATIPLYNFSCVSEPQEDGLATYVYDSNPGDADFYGIGSIASTPTTVIATTVRGYMQKSDAGTRTAAVQIKSGATTVASPTLVLTTSGFTWAWRTDLTDPNTGAAWTPAAVNNAQIGPKVIA